MQLCVVGVGQGVDNLGGQTEEFHDPNDVVGQIKFPGFVAVPCHSLVGVVVVVPSFSEGKQANPPEIARAIGRVIVAIPPDMSCRVDEPGHVVDDNDSQAHCPEKDRESQAPGDLADRKESCTRQEKEWSVRGMQESLEATAVEIGSPSLEMRLETFSGIPRLEPEDV